MSSKLMFSTQELKQTHVDIIAVNALKLSANFVVICIKATE